MSDDPTETLAGELRRRGLAAPARLLLDAHRPLRPLLADASTFVAPILSPLFGRRIEALQALLHEPAAYDRLIDRLRDRA
jgi:hypothetical protein